MHGVHVPCVGECRGTRKWQWWRNNPHRMAARGPAPRAVMPGGALALPLAGCCMRARSHAGSRRAGAPPSCAEALCDAWCGHHGAGVHAASAAMEDGLPLGDPPTVHAIPVHLHALPECRLRWLLHRFALLTRQQPAKLLANVLFLHAETQTSMQATRICRSQCMPCTAKSAAGTKGFLDVVMCGSRVSPIIQRRCRGRHRTPKPGPVRVDQCAQGDGPALANTLEAIDVGG